ncbi:MAG: cellulase family glycosylhydrolase [Polyangia bacterium]
MTKRKVLLGIAILGTALGGACSDNGNGAQGSAGAQSSSSETQASAGDKGTGGRISPGGTIAGNSGSGAGASSGGGADNGGQTSPGGGTSLGGTNSGGKIESGGATGGMSGATGGATGNTTPTGGATGGRGGTTGATAGDTTGGATGHTGGATGGMISSGGAAGGVVGGMTGGATGTGGVAAGGKTGATGGAAGGATGSGGGSAGDKTGATGGATGSAGGATGGLPALHVEGPLIKDPSGKTIVLRGYALIDIGALYQQTNSSAGITKRIDAVAAAGLQAHVVRMPVYPETDFNGGDPYYSGLPYPVGTPAPAGQKVTVMTGPDYISKVLKPAVDYATSQNLYAIIDLHQIDDTNTAHNSGAAATSFWTDIAPQFKDYSNVIYELYNEPINSGMAWATFKTQVQTWIDTVRTAAPDNLIVVPSMSWDQHPGDAASSPPTGTNLVYTAHIYPNNWGASFQQQLATATKLAPVFITEWGYSSPNTSANWGTPFQTIVNGDDANWTAWVADSSWGPSMFSNSALTTLTDFGTLVKNWLAAEVSQDWVE